MSGKDWLEQVALLKANYSIWDEMSTETLLLNLESNYKHEHIKKFGITDIVNTRDGFLIKWTRRVLPLNDEQMKKRFHDYS